MKTTFEELRKYAPCSNGEGILLKNLGRSSGEVTFKEILESNGILDAIWCLRVLPDYDLNVMKFKLLCARMVEHFDELGKCRDSLDVLESFIYGDTDISTLAREHNNMCEYLIGFTGDNASACATMDATLCALKSNSKSTYTAVSSILNWCQIGCHSDIYDRLVSNFKEIFCKDA